MYETKHGIKCSHCALTCFSRDRLFSFGKFGYVMLVYILETLSICVI